MKLSPLEFAREFEKLKSDLARQPASDLRLLRLVRFWEQLAPVAGVSAYESYADDYRSLLTDVIKADALSDLSIDSLKQTRAVLTDLIGLSGIDAASTKLVDAATAVTLRIVTLLFYVGAYSEAVSLCAEISGDKMPALPDPDDLRGMSPLDTLKEICKSVRSDNDVLYDLLQPILSEWEKAASAVNHDRVWCLFVDKDGSDAAAAGRMRMLKGAVEQSVSAKKSSVASDQIAFNNQVKTPDDPFIGVVYESLKAVRLGLRSAGFVRRAEGTYRAFLSIKGSDRTFTGDSIGLAAALVSFTQLLHPEVMRHDRFIASDIAVTGSISADGEITAVNDSTIAAKIKRAFFSHVRYVVVPEANAATARAALSQLHERYPNRRLSLIHAAHLDVLIDDRNVIRSEKVCIGEFIVKKTVHYSRATRVQVPLLIGLIWLLLAMLWPLHFNPWFDWNPRYVRVTERGFEALNRDSVVLWGKEFECEVNIASSDWCLGDLEGIGRNNVIVALKGVSSANCDYTANVFVYDYQGEELWRRHMAKQGDYPADPNLDPLWAPVGIRMIETDTTPFLLTAVTRSYPAAAHIRMWSASGDSTGWYILAGSTALDYRLFSNVWDTGYIFGGINNRMGGAFLCVLPRQHLQGVSPPYFDSACDLTWVKRGNQIVYALFPPSDLCRLQGHLYNGATEMIVQSDSVLRVLVWEGEYEYFNSQPVVLEYTLNSDLRVVSVLADDTFRAARDKAVNDGDLSSYDWSAYLDSMRNAVKYWTDSGWISEGQLRKTEEK